MSLSPATKPLKCIHLQKFMASINTPINMIVLQEEKLTIRIEVMKFFMAAKKYIGFLQSEGCKDHDEILARGTQECAPLMDEMLQVTRDAIDLWRFKQHANDVPKKSIRPIRPSKVDRTYDVCYRCRKPALIPQSRFYAIPIVNSYDYNFVLWHRSCVSTDVLDQWEVSYSSWCKLKDCQHVLMG